MESEDRTGAKESTSEGADAFAHALIMREADRRRALVEEDWLLFDDLIADDIVHVHTTGIVQGKPELINHARSFLKFIEIERGDLLVRPLGPEAAVMTGEMTNIVRRRDLDEQVIVRAFVTQVWVRREGSWKLLSFHAVRLPQDN